MFDNLTDSEQNKINNEYKFSMKKLIENVRNERNYKNPKKMGRISTQDLVLNFHKKHSKSINLFETKEIIISLILKNLKVLNYIYL